MALPFSIRVSSFFHGYFVSRRINDVLSLLEPCSIASLRKFISYSHFSIWFQLGTVGLEIISTDGFCYHRQKSGTSALPAVGLAVLDFAFPMPALLQSVLFKIWFDFWLAATETLVKSHSILSTEFLQNVLSERGRGLLTE